MTTTATTLRESIDQKALMAKTKRLDLSFNELLDMVKSDELEIQPAFQRIFVWDLYKQSQFIESLLLELPVPPIYVVEKEEGKYILVDGLQRLSTYLHFRGELANAYKGISRGTGFTLDGCDIATELNGKQWRDLDTALQIRLKRAFVSVQVIRKDSAADLKFHMFKRLNDGGTPVSTEQVRNCVMRMLPKGETLMDFVDRLSKSAPYVASCVDALTEEQRNDQVDQELVLRFFALKNNRAAFKKFVGPFIDEFAERIARENVNFDYIGEEAIFVKTFQVLAASTAELSFTFPNKSNTDLTKGFSAYHFEAVTIGIQSVLTRLDPQNAQQMERLKDALRAARLGNDFHEVSSGGGKNSPGPLNKRIEIITQALASI
jgi:hypothetical protein